MGSTIAPDVRSDEGLKVMSENADVVELRDVSLHFGSHRVLDGFNLRVRQGELVALLGPSGSGKTTVIRTLAGFLTPSEGAVLLSGREVTHVPAHKRGIGVVFQSYALFPHMNVVDNLAYSLKVKRLGRAAIKRRCHELLELVRLEGVGAKRPAQLSGGQQQRVALARALAMDPKVLLLDEPLSNLDANLRRDVGEEIRRLQRSTGTTAILVTHDRQEAFGMADRIAVLRDGRIEQLGSPRELYTKPASAFMARFVGEANLVHGTVTEADSGDGLLTVSTAMGALRGVGDAAQGNTVQVLIRPEDLQFAAQDAGPIHGRLVETFYYGSNLVATVDVAGQRLSVVTTGSSAQVPEAGETVWLTVSSTDCVVLAEDGS
jgi:ABC-type Fe3+/spermidine/putrescine transport system ATPase subunit